MVQVHRPEDQRGEDVDPGLHPRSDDPSIRNAGVRGQEEMGVSVPAEGVTFRPWVSGRCPLALVGAGAIFITQFTDSNAHLPWKQAQTHPEITLYQLGIP